MTTATKPKPMPTVIKRPLRTLRPDEPLTLLQSNVVQCVRHYVGFSLLTHNEELRAFISRGIDDPHTILAPDVSDCGLFAFAVWHAVGVDHPLLATPYHIGKAIEWLVEIARVFQAVRYPGRDGAPTVGSLMHYKTRGKNDDHVEFLLTNPTLGKGWVAEHAGGGRPHCGVDMGMCDILWSVGRPLQEWYDLRAFKTKDDEDELFTDVDDQDEKTEH